MSRIDDYAEVELCDRTPCDSCKERGLDCKIRKNGHVGCRACNTLKLRCSNTQAPESSAQVHKEQLAASQTETPEAIEEQAAIGEAPTVEGSSFDVDMLLEPRSEATIGEEATQEATGLAVMEPVTTRVTFAIPAAGSEIDLASPTLSAIAADLALEDAMNNAFEGLGQPLVEANPE